MFIALQVAPLPPLPPIGGIPGGPPEMLIIAGVSIIAIVVGGIVLWPILRALGRRIEGKVMDPGVLAEIEQLRARVAELEQGAGRLTELEERMDFSERLLTQGRENQPADRSGR